MATAVICEFNPFHNGHKYLLQQAKKVFNEPVVAIMSGSFTQRGEMAVTDKFSRAKAALENGADLVLELPAAYAVANAQKFAQCGTKIARSFACVHQLAFGCETDNTDLLYAAAQAYDNSQVSIAVKEEMKSGNYYPRAFENAVRKVLGSKTADVLSSPNNILAAEYLRGLKDSNITALPIKRIGVQHDSNFANKGFASASLIRQKLQNGEDVKPFMPIVPEHTTSVKNLERIMLYRLRCMCTADFLKLPDVSEGLENRIMYAVNNFNSVKEIINYVKTKRYTHSRIRRILICALLGITNELQNTPVEYVRVLGFTKNGSMLLKDCSLNVVTSASDGLKLGANTAKLLAKDILATDVASLAYDLPQKCGIDFTNQIVKVD